MPEDIVSIKPDMQWLSQLDCSGIIVTAPGDQVDFVSRFFAPRLGIPEDPVTGSSHCSLVPYWAEKLSKKKLTARQLSARGGELFCEHAGERVKIGGRAATYLSGEIEI
jgi:predicted PhzF superfamily epimerase YddE/YHI9